MKLNLQVETFHGGKHPISLYRPDGAEVLQQYRLQKNKDSQTPFPYWTQVWPAAKALAQYLLQHPPVVSGKTVLELAAGLGLPSLVAARFAQHVCCSDYLPEAVAVMEQSANLNHYKNISCRVLDWHHLPDDLTADVLLLSDVNYEPEEFAVLYTVLSGFISRGSTVVLSTPQRLMAKSFIEQLLPWCVRQQEMIVSHGEQEVAVSVLELKEPMPQ